MSKRKKIGSSKFAPDVDHSMLYLCINRFRSIKICPLWLNGKCWVFQTFTRSRSQYDLTENCYIDEVQCTQKKYIHCD